jgi:CheY-like chemotaxis protein
MSGIELLRRIRTMPEMKDLPVIVMTSSADPREEEECKRLNVTSYLHKSITSAFTKDIADTLQSFDPVQGRKPCQLLE